jgi:hypothetical protein
VAALVRRDPLEARFTPRAVGVRLELLRVEWRAPGGAEEPFGARATGARQVLG